MYLTLRKAPEADFSPESCTVDLIRKQRVRLCVILPAGVPKSRAKLWDPGTILSAKDIQEDPQEKGKDNVYEETFQVEAEYCRYYSELPRIRHKEGSMDFARIHLLWQIRVPPTFLQTEITGGLRKTRTQNKSQPMTFAMQVEVTTVDCDAEHLQLCILENCPLLLRDKDSGFIRSLVR
ncbi:hypothetical protein DL96DRAFT_1562292 [Flagelloscypha sp. PMI_526]|nr:hypothetical protein DL96DRAFT_1562292 [Flagelloscypha sp. PMI_526]